MVASAEVNVKFAATPDAVASPVLQSLMPMGKSPVSEVPMMSQEFVVALRIGAPMTTLARAMTTTATLASIFVLRGWFCV